MILCRLCYFEGHGVLPTILFVQQLKLNAACTDIVAISWLPSPIDAWRSQYQDFNPTSKGPKGLGRQPRAISFGFANLRATTLILDNVNTVQSYFVLERNLQYPAVLVSCSKKHLEV